MTITEQEAIEANKIKNVTKTTTYSHVKLVTSFYCRVLCVQLCRS